jgi:hypothetical protein
MFVEIIKNTDGYIGGLATYFKKPQKLNGVLYEMNETDAVILHKLLLARDGVELVQSNEDVNIGGVKLKLHDHSNKRILKLIKEEEKSIKTHNKADEFVKYIHS